MINLVSNVFSMEHTLKINLSRTCIQLYVHTVMFNLRKLHIGTLTYDVAICSVG